MEAACTPSSRSSISLVMIDSVSVNIDAAELSKSEKPQKCEHFTIRGFVSSDTRIKNGTHCWPVSVDGNDAISKDDTDSRLYMDVAKFRHWQCRSCLSEIDVQGRLENAVNNKVNCTKLLKTKNHRLHRSLENVLAHLLKKPEQHPKLGCTKCKSTISMLEFSQKQLVDAGKLNIKGVEENELHIAASNFAPKLHVRKESDCQLAIVANVFKNKEQWLVSRPTSSIKVSEADGAKHNRRHFAGMKLVQNHQNHDDSEFAGRRKTKKLRLLTDLFDKNAKGDQPAVTRGFNANEATKVSYSALGQKKIKKSQEKDNQHSQMQNAGSSAGKGVMGKHPVFNSKSADAEIHVGSKDEGSQAQKMLSGSNQGAGVQTNSYSRGQKRKIIELCKKQLSVSTCRPFHGRMIDPQQKSLSPSSQFMGEIVYTKDKVHQDVNMVTPADNSKEICGNSVSRNALMENVQSGHEARSVQGDQSDGFLAPRQNTRYLVPHTENINFQNGFTMQDLGESKSLCKSLQQTNSVSGLKRGPYTGNKKRKYIARTNALTVVHQTELLFSTSNNTVLGTQESSEHSKNMMREVGTLDDIPMEIVELMAKNKYERRLHEEGDNYHQPKRGSKTKHLVGSTSVLTNDRSTEAQNSKSHLPFSSPNARVISEKGSGISNKRQNDKMMQRYTNSTYCPVSSSERTLSTGFQSPSLGHSKPDLFRNCKYDINEFPPQHRASPKSRALYEKWQPASRQSDKTIHGWPMIPPYPPVHMLDTLQDSGLHPFDVGKVPTCSSYVVEGRCPRNFSLSGYGPITDSFRPEASNGSLPYRLDSQPQMSVSPDPNSNETLTAMHLLSLMDGGTQLSKVTNLEAAASRNIFERSFSNEHLSKELSLNNLALGKSNHKFKQPSPYGHQSSNSKSSFKCSPHTPLVGSFVRSLPDSSSRYMNGNVSTYSSLMPSQSYEKVKRLAEHGECHVNRNPMEFTTPGPQNEYMIGTEELKFRNRIHIPFITAPVSISTFKQNGATSCTPTCNKL